MKPINNNGLSRTLQLIHALRDAFEPTHRIALAYRQVEKNQSEVITEFPGVLERPQVHGYRGAHGHPVYVVAALDHVLAQGASRRGHQYVVDRTVAGAADGFPFFQVDRPGPRQALAYPPAPRQPTRGVVPPGKPGPLPPRTPPPLP